MSFRDETIHGDETDRRDKRQSDLKNSFHPIIPVNIFTSVAAMFTGMKAIKEIKDKAI